MDASLFNVASDDDDDDDNDDGSELLKIYKPGA